jgi:hypothetical protein
MGNKYHVDQIAEVVFVETIYAIIPLLPLTLPSLWLIARSFGNAQVLILFEALQISKTEYEDEDDVDEFDAEAPPPTKDVDLNPSESSFMVSCSLLVILLNTPMQMPYGAGSVRC